MYVQLKVLLCAYVFNEDVALNYHRGPREPAIQELLVPRADCVELQMFFICLVK